MLKVVCVVDKEGTALDRLAKGVAKYHDNLDYQVVAVHPKRPDPEQLAAFEEAAIDADVIDWQYFRTAEMLRGRYDWLKDKKHILTHNNPYSIEEQDWNGYDVNVGNNDYIYKRLGEITQSPVEYIPLTVDTDFWKYNVESFYGNASPEWKPNHKVIMVANRIESKKGVLPVALACAKLNLRMILIGAISDIDYFRDIMATGFVTYFQQISDEKLRTLYYDSTVHVCNSVDGFESGTLPILESMLCGVPVLTRNVGHVPDLYNGENLVIHDGEPEDVEAITTLLRDMMGDKKKLGDMRDKAWNTAKNRSHERRAYMYQKLYRQLAHPTEVPVSVVVPIYDKPDVIRECFNAIATQSHQNLELIVCDDNPESNETMVKEYASMVTFPVRYIHTAIESDDYGLARARNIGTIEATGDIMVYCDQRMVMDKEAVKELVKRSAPRVWLYGNKGAKKEFVENFSCIRRQDIINAGMFNERIDSYGGMSQECRSRFKNQGGRTEYVESAKAAPAGKSSNRNKRRQEIINMKNRLFKMGLA